MGDGVSKDNKIDAIKFFTTRRIDLVVGVDYVDYYERGLKTDFFRMLYIAHKKSWNNLKEGIHMTEMDFISRFNKIIESIKEDKINHKNVLVRNKNGNLFLGNGFHRVSALYYYNHVVNYEIAKKATRRKNFGCIDYDVDINFFKRGKDGPPLADEYCNYIMLRFLEDYCKEYSCMVLYHEEKNLPLDIEDEINKNLIFEIKVVQTENFNLNFIRSLYLEENWVKEKNRAKVKATSCFEKSKKEDEVRILFLKKYPQNELVHLKKKIRDFYKRGNHSVHTTDYMWENVNLSHLFNSNTISFLRCTPTIFNNFKTFEKCFSDLKKFCEQQKIDTRRICITSSAVLSVYCIRDCEDIDLLVDREYIETFKNTQFDTHNVYAEQNHYGVTSDDIIYNPNNYFYYRGIKFCTLEIIYEYKQYRIQNNLFGSKSVEKDKNDTKLIEDSYKFKNEWY